MKSNFRFELIEMLNDPLSLCWTDIKPIEFIKFLCFISSLQKLHLAEC